MRVFLRGIDSDPEIAKTLVEIAFDAKSIPYEDHLFCSEVEAVALAWLAQENATVDGAVVLERWKEIGHDARMDARRLACKFLRSLP